jgi:signal transduction histidine kinase
MSGSVWPFMHDEALQRDVLNSLARQLASGILVVDARSGQPLMQNPQMEAICGRVVLENGAPVPAWVGYRADGSSYAPHEWPLARGLRGETVEPEEIEIIRPDGGRAMVRMSAEPIFGDAGEMRLVVLTGLDVTGQRRTYASRRFLSDASALLSSTQDPVDTLRNIARLAVPILADWCTIELLDEAGEIQRVAVEHIDKRKARAVEELARRHRLDPTSATGVAQVVRSRTPALYDEIRPEVLNEVAESPAHRKLLMELGIRSVMIVPLVARDKALGAISFVSAESGRQYSSGDLEVAEELASRAALAIENSRLFDQSRAANEAKSDFLAVMSHELRTPLTAIIGYAELFQLGVPEPVTPRQHDQAERIEVSARHLLQIIEEILTLVTLDSGEAKVRYEKVAVAELLRRAANIVEPMARSKGLPLLVRLPDESHVINTDPDKLLQILLNLLSNAVKFTEKGDLRLAADIEGDEAVFTVSDSGIGLDSDNVRKIFEPFWQVERPITRRAGGTGLGLTICRRLSDLLGAHLSVESSAGAGSTFTVRLPLTR